MKYIGPIVSLRNQTAVVSNTVNDYVWATFDESLCSQTIRLPREHFKERYTAVVFLFADGVTICEDPKNLGYSKVGYDLTINFMSEKFVQQNLVNIHAIAVVSDELVKIFWIAETVDIVRCVDGRFEGIFKTCKP